MDLTQITVSYARTQSLGNYSNVKPSISLTAILAEGDDPEAARAQLLAEAKAFVEEEIDLALEDDGQVARYSHAPRYRLIVTQDTWIGDRWRREEKAKAPEQLLILLPDDLKLPDAGHRQVWWTDVYNGRKLRIAPAERRAAEWLESHDGARLIDCRAGDLSRVPAWVWEAPALPITALTPERVRNLILLAHSITPVPSIEEIAAWPLERQQAAAEEAARIHLIANDNDLDEEADDTDDESDDEGDDDVRA